MESAWEQLKDEWERLFQAPGKSTDGVYNKSWKTWVKKARTMLFSKTESFWLPDESVLARDDRLLSIVIGGLTTVPDALFSPMLRVAVYNPDPSFNRRYIEVCLKHWGGVKVNDELFRYTEGTDIEKAGVANAFYHSLSHPRQGYLLEWTEGPTSDQVQRAHNWFLEEFIANEDVQVRRNLIPWLRLSAPEKYPVHLLPLVPEAIAIARSHPDEYIRHRLEIQLGASGPFMAKPSRSPV